jgi:hypothetical protein
MIIATVENNGETFFLRGTTWAYRRERATEFTSVVDAKAACDRAARFMPKALAKKIKIVDEG